MEQGVEKSRLSLFKDQMSNMNLEIPRNKMQDHSIFPSQIPTEGSDESVSTHVHKEDDNVERESGKEISQTQVIHLIDASQEEGEIEMQMHGNGSRQQGCSNNTLGQQQNTHTTTKIP